MISSNTSNYNANYQQVKQVCDNYFYRGRLVTKVNGLGNRETPALRLLRMASWLTAVVPAFFGIVSLANQAFLKKKVFISYQNQTWKEQSLNQFQLILRKIGFYKSTHFKTIFEAWDTQKRSSGDSTRDERIKAVWYKKTFLPLGNTTLGQAKIVCFPEIHTDIPYRRAMAQFIDDNYQEGDVILVESLPVGESMESTLNSQTGFLKTKCQVHGWDHKDIKTMHGPLAEKTFKLGEQSAKASKELKDLIGEDKFTFTLEEQSELENKFTTYIDCYKDYFELFHSTKELDRCVNNMKSAFESWREKAALGKSTEKDFTFFRDSMKEAGKCMHNQLYTTNCKLSGTSTTEKVSKGKSARNTAMCEEIEKQVQEKRIFIIGGANHFLAAGTPEDQETVIPVKQTLHKYPFVMLPSKQVFKKSGYKHLNSDMKPLPINTLG